MTTLIQCRVRRAGRGTRHPRCRACRRGNRRYRHLSRQRGVVKSVALRRTEMGAFDRNLHRHLAGLDLAHPKIRPINHANDGAAERERRQDAWVVVSISSKHAFLEIESLARLQMYQSTICVCLDLHFHSSYTSPVPIHPLISAERKLMRAKIRNRARRSRSHAVQED